MVNPFVCGKEVRGHQFYDRREACDELFGYLKDGSTNVWGYSVGDPVFVRYLQTATSARCF